MLIDPDFDWELFPRPSDEAPGERAWAIRAAVAAGVVGCWFVDRPVAVAAACVAVAFQDVRQGLRLARAIPDPAGARIGSLFRYAWGAWKVGVTAVVMFAATIVSEPWRDAGAGPPLELAVAVPAGIGGFLASATLTAAGVAIASRAGMRIWIGEGVNQARTLLMAMLVTAFAAFALVPSTILLMALSPLRSESIVLPLGMMAFWLGSMFIAPIILLGLVDRIGRRVIAERPGKFGPKVPSVGKWDA